MPDPAWILIGLLVLGGLAGTPSPDSTAPEQVIVEQAVEVAAPIAPMTSITPSLKEFAQNNGLPVEQRIPIGVAEIYDATGKTMNDLNGTQSKIITQAPGLFMMSALQNLDYFIVLDRTKVGFDLFMREQELKGKARLNHNDRPALNEIVGAPFIVTGAITSFQFDVKTSGAGAKVAGKGLGTKYAVATVQADIVLLDTTTSETQTFSYLDTIEGSTKGLDIFSFVDGNTILDIQAGGSREAVYDLIVRRICEEAALDIAKSQMVQKYLASTE